MNILTKICIVVVALASMVAAPVFIHMATVPENYRSLFEKEKAHYALAQTIVKEYAAENKRLSSRLKAQEERFLGETGRKQASIDDLTRELETLKVKYEADKARVADINAKLTQLTKTSEAQAKTIETLQGQLKAAWTAQSGQQATIIALSNTLEESKAANARLEKAIKVVRQNHHDAEATVIELNRKIQELLKGGALATTGEAPAPTPAKKVSGSVTAVSGSLLSINIGSAHGLKSGMELTVYRGSSYVGTMKIERVEVGEAAGTLTTKKLAPRAGDNVTSDLN